MRLQQGSSSSNSDSMQKFAEWILQVGDGIIGGPNYGEATIEFPEEVLIRNTNNRLASIVDATYPSLLQHLAEPRYF